jgi:hypothetical protein
MKEQDKQWQLEGRSMFSHGSIAAIPPAAEGLLEAEPQASAMA